MNKATSCLVALLVAVLIPFDALAQSDMELDIPFTETPPAIDAVKDDVYPVEGQAGHFTLDNVRSGAVTDDADLSANAYAVWDGDFLYVFMSVNDDVLIADSPGQTWTDDSVELYIDGGNEKCEECYDANDTQYRFRIGSEAEGIPLITEAGGGAGGSTDTEGIEWTNILTDSGYDFEIALPWNLNDVTAQTGTIIGFDLHLNDDDVGGDEREGKLHWSDSPGDDQWQHANKFGTATLVGGAGAVEAVARITRTPSGGAFEGMEITFDASTSTAPGAIQSFDWDFGDGSTASGAVVTHTYTEAGSYDVSLTITDDGGNSDVATSTVDVRSSLGLESNPLEIPMAPSPPVLDGERESVWESAQVVELENVVNGSPPASEEDFSVRTWVMWDPDALYLFYEVKDDVLLRESDTGWRNDRPEVYIDAGHEKTERGRDENDAYFEFEWNSDVITGAGSEKAPSSEYAWVITDEGYDIEAIVTWGEMDHSFEIDQLIGFELMVNDSDVADQRDTKLGWFSTIDEAWQWSSELGSARLVAELTTPSVDDPAELPGSFSIESVYPNPFNPSTTALINVQQAGDYAVKVHNVLGQTVAEYALSIQTVGQVSVPVDLKDQASGVYLFSVENRATGQVMTAKAMLLK